MRYKTILFDLDGTLTDSSPGITNSVTRALAQMGIQEENPAKLLSFIGPPLYDSFQKYYDFSPSEARQAVEHYRAYYSDTGIFENSVYQGITELLSELQSCGAQIILATSKPTLYAERILAHFGLAGYFSAVVGAEMDGTRMHKTEVIRDALINLGDDPDLATVVMIGDREHDILGAHDNGIASMGVLYGYGSREELMQASPTYLVDSPEEVGALLHG